MNNSQRVTRLEEEKKQSMPEQVTTYFLEDGVYIGEDGKVLKEEPTDSPDTLNVIIEFV